MKQLLKLLPGHRHRDCVRRRMEKADRVHVLAMADNAETELHMAMRQVRNSTSPEALEKGTEALVVIAGALETLARRSRADQL
ncbi:hypothetical protein AB0H73_06230 [Streptomyces olivoreticuli]